MSECVLRLWSLLKCTAVKVCFVLFYFILFYFIILVDVVVDEKRNKSTSRSRRSGWALKRNCRIEPQDMKLSSRYCSCMSGDDVMMLKQRNRFFGTIIFFAVVGDVHSCFIFHHLLMFPCVVFSRVLCVFCLLLVGVGTKC